MRRGFRSRHVPQPQLLYLARDAHPSTFQRLFGVRPHDRYLDYCWVPVVGSDAVTALRLVHDLAAPVGSEPHTIAPHTLSEMLGLDSHRDKDLRRSALGRSLDRAAGEGLLRWDPDRGVVGVFDPVPLLDARRVASRRLPDSARTCHRTYLTETAKLLHRAGYNRSAVTAWRESALAHTASQAAAESVEPAAQSRATERLDAAAQQAMPAQDAISQ